MAHYLDKLKARMAKYDGEFDIATGKYMAFYAS